MYNDSSYFQTFLKGEDSNKYNDSESIYLSREFMHKIKLKYRHTVNNSFNEEGFSFVKLEYRTDLFDFRPIPK